MKISYSAIDTYLTCSEKYRLEKVEGFIPVDIPPPFIIGKAFDDLTGMMFESKMKDNHKELLLETVISKLHQDFAIFKADDGEMIDVAKDYRVKFPKADVDFSLLNQEDFDIIQKCAHDNGLRLENTLEDIEALYDMVVGSSDAVEEGFLLTHKQIVYRTVLRKLEVMLTYVYKWIMENVQDTISTQRKLEEYDDEGNCYVGYIDAECILVGETEPRTIDVKSSRLPKKYYPDDCIESSLQLHLYSIWSYNKVGYVVVSKDIAKKESTREKNMIRVVLGEVTEEGKEEALEIMNETIENIKNQKFEKNTNACMKYGKCPWFHICFNKG